jgi:hypothetical protein
MFLTRLTASPHFYTLLYAAICLLALFNISEVVFLLLHKRTQEKDEAAKELLKHRIATGILTVTSPEEVLPRPRTALQYEAYGEAASSIIESFEGEIAWRASQLLYAFGVDLYFQRLARNPAWYKRAHAIDILASLKLKKNKEFFAAVFRSETSNEVKYRILYGLSLLARGREDVYTISALLSTLPYLTAKYTEDIFLNVINALKESGKEDEFGSFLMSIMTDAKITAGVKRDCLSACHAAGCEKAGPIVREYYKRFQAEPEIIIACVKTLANIGDFSVLPETLRHADWRVRLVSLKYAHLCGADVSLQLKDLMRDGNYHVRLNAALALSRLGDAGFVLLRAETASPDKFSADAARYALGSLAASS